MNRIYVFLIAALAWLSHSNNQYYQLITTEPHIRYVDRTFEPYMKAFETESGKKIQEDLSVVFMAFDGDDTIGYCQYHEDGTRSIVIHPEYWSNATAVKKEMLIYHELAHCVLNKAHDTNIDEKGVPKSLMYPYITDKLVEAYLSNRKKYIKELFGVKNE